MTKCDYSCKIEIQNENECAYTLNRTKFKQKYEEFQTQTFVTNNWIIFHKIFVLILSLVAWINYWLLHHVQKKMQNAPKLEIIQSNCEYECQKHTKFIQHHKYFHMLNIWFSILGFQLIFALFRRYVIKMWNYAWILQKFVACSHLRLSN